MTVTDARIAAVTEWETWHAGREEQLRQPHDWLSVSGYLWLPRSAAALPGLPGRWWADDDGAHVRAPASEGARLIDPDGAPGEVLDGEAGEVLDGEAGVSVGEAGSSRFLLTADDVLVEVVVRGGFYAVRLRDPRTETRSASDGVPTYDYDPSWVVDVTTEVYDEPRPTRVGTAAPGLVQVANAVGEVSFERDGATHRLVAVGHGPSWAVLFSDRTSGVTSSAWRIVVVTGEAATGRAVLDLNRAVNMPYAFTDYGTCPRPVDGNRIDLSVTAGERAPAGRSGVPGEDAPTRVPAVQPA
ncbi:MAG: DUF1684 domain-containing protein [Actinomycetales bacterium]|nr:DUF1684 domain-containing protein [Actinomycetales bacterium]